jgi:anti-anti-sigma regulatory factor
MSGTLTVSDAEVLERCIKEVQSEPPQYVLLHMGAITSVEDAAIRPFTLFQQAFRSKAKLLICGLPDGVEKTFNRDGVLREAEVVEDLVAGLQVIMKWEKS